MKKWLRWEKGRQEGSYSKMLLIPEWLSNFLNADAYLLKFPVGSSVIKHKDPVQEGYKHYRMNITLSGKGKGRMYILGPIIRFWRIEIFRPDLYEHGLEPIKGKIYMLSFGCRI